MARFTSTAPGINDAILRATAGGVIRSRPPEMITVGQVNPGISVAQIERLGLEFRCIGGELAEGDGRVQRLSVGNGSVVQFAVPDPADQVGLVTVGRLAFEQEPGTTVQCRPQRPSAGQQQVELAPQ